MARPPKIILPPPADKGKQAVGQLSSAFDNELLNAAEVTLGSATTSMAKMLRERMFGGVFDVSNPCFFALASHLTCSTKQ